jgi:hypothetical protein
VVREQLNRLLAHALFSHSKRYPIFLAYIVEQTLLGNAADLKERTIGVEAFERKPDYDVNLDPVVRTSAAEVRKRLIQYYYDQAHAGELLIELTPGSYVPTFREPELLAGVPDSGEIPSSIVLGSRLNDPLSHPSGPLRANLQLPARSRRSTAFQWASIAALVVLALAAGVAIGRHRPVMQPSNMQLFWQPITSSQGPVTYCLGESTSYPQFQPSPPDATAEVSFTGRLNGSDVITLSRSIVPLAPRSGGFRILSASQASFAQLREGPVVLIGAFSNQWTMRETQNLRFGFDFKDGMPRLVDRKSSPPVSRLLQMDVSGHKVVRDFAVVARLHDGLIGQPVIIIAGILGEGTEAASEVLYNPVYLDSMLQKAPKNWDRMNLEALIETDVIEDHPGPPTILAVETW